MVKSHEKFHLDNKAVGRNKKDNSPTDKGLANYSTQAKPSPFLSL